MKRIVLFILILLLLPIFTTAADGTDNILSQGDKGEDVVRIQTRLFDLGFYTYKPTGSFQTVTRSAVVSYQAACGLSADGRIGEDTMRSLFTLGAKRVDFHAEVPLSFTAQGAITQKGEPVSWKTVREKLTEGETYHVRNAATGETVSLVFSSGEKHAETAVPERPYSERTAAVSMLTAWLGSANSFYKCAVLFELDGQWIAASMQWDGEAHACVYFKDSTSHVLNLPDAEHEANIRKASY
ncbi:MAG: peptidoglycan-binding protein [Clostridia bacterium]|nr:peptidoglycan-binding protein [Clostridia bacterium]